MLKIRIYLTSIFSGFLGQLAFNLCMHRTSLCIPVHPKSLGIRIRIYLPINVKCPGPISTCKAQPAFEAYAFDLSTWISKVSVKENQEEEVVYPYPPTQDPKELLNSSTNIMKIRIYLSLPIPINISRITGIFYPACWYFDNGATCQINDVLIGCGGLHHVLPLYCLPDVLGGVDQQRGQF